MVDDQILTPIPDADLVGTADDAVSIMCYQVPGEVTIDGKPILGGLDIDASDYAFAAMCYPLPAVSAGSPPPMVKTATPHVSVAAHASHASHDTGDGIASTAFDSDGSSALPMLDHPGDSSGADTAQTTAGALPETLASASSPAFLPASPIVSEVHLPLVEARGQVLAELPNGVRFSLPHSVTEQVIARLFTGVEPTATTGAPLSATIAGAPEHPAHDLLPSSSSSSGALLPRILKGILSDATSPITDAGVIMACAITGHSWARLKAGKNVRYDMESDVGKLALPVDPVKLAAAKAAEAASRQSLDSAIAAINRALASCTNNFMGTHGPSMVYTGLAPVHGLNGVTRVIGGTGDNPLLDPARYDPPTPANLPGEMLYTLALSANFTNSKANSNPNSAAPISPGQRTDGQLQGYQGQGAYTGFVQGRDDGQSNLFTTYRHVIPPDQVRWIPRPVPDTFPPVPTVDSNANPGPFPTEGYWGMMGSIKDQADLAAQGMYFQDADPARASGKALTPTTVLGYTHGMIQAIYDVEFQKLTAPGKNAGTPYEIAVGDHTTKLSSCVACAFFMEATGYPASSTHLGRGECWAPLYPESPSGKAIDITSKQNIARKAANDKWAVYCKTIVDSVLACDGFRGQLKTDAHRASFDQLRTFVRGKDAGTYANLILDALTVRKSETARLLETLE